MSLMLSSCLPDVSFISPSRLRHSRCPDSRPDSILLSAGRMAADDSWLSEMVGLGDGGGLAASMEAWKK